MESADGNFNIRSSMRLYGSVSSGKTYFCVAPRGTDNHPGRGVPDPARHHTAACHGRGGDQMDGQVLHRIRSFVIRHAGRHADSRIDGGSRLRPEGSR